MLRSIVRRSRTRAWGEGLRDQYYLRADGHLSISPTAGSVTSDCYNRTCCGSPLCQLTHFNSRSTRAPDLELIGCPARRRLWRTREHICRARRRKTDRVGTFPVSPWNRTGQIFRVGTRKRLFRKGLRIPLQGATKSLILLMFLALGGWLRHASCNKRRNKPTNLITSQKNFPLIRYATTHRRRDHRARASRIVSSNAAEGLRMRPR